MDDVSLALTLIFEAGTRLPSKYEVTGKCIVYSVAIPAWPMLTI